MGKYVDRGDPAVPDFTELTLTLDGAPHDLDLSGIVAALGALHLVHFRVELHPTEDVILRFREKGNVNWENKVEIAALVSAVGMQKNDCWVMMDANRIIEYVGSMAAGTIKLTVRGWIED